MSYYKSMVVYFHKVEKNPIRKPLFTITSMAECYKMVVADALSKGLIVCSTWEKEKEVIHIDWATQEINPEYEIIAQDWRCEDINGDSYYYYVEYST